MKAYELIEILYEGMKRMSKIGIKMEDYKHLAMCMEYNELVAQNAKNAIGNYYGVEKDSEEEAYLIGYIMQRIIRTLFRRKETNYDRRKLVAEY